MRDLNHLVIYEVFVRNHAPNGTFHDVIADLPRIRQMGVDVVWLMPIHPIGAVQRKGSLGSPYSITDYRAINPEYGTLDDFRDLVAAVHAHGMQIWIDVVYNHTAHDAWSIAAHPEWYHLNADGQPQTLVPEWSDVIDLNHSAEGALWAHLTDALVQWVEIGVDGFRCDVAPLVPLAFWQRARAACAAVNPNVRWLAESVHMSFINWRRGQARTGHADGELYDHAFDLTYDYDIWDVWRAVALGRERPSLYLDMLRMQSAVLPAHAVKMRCAENHDQPRIMGFVSQPQALAWTAFQAFNKGALLLYAGQESAATHTPSLFDSDPIDWGSYALQPWLTRLIAIKRRTGGAFTLLAAEPAVVAAWQPADATLVGVFNIASARGRVGVQLPDGDYDDLLGGGRVTVQGGQIELPEAAVILAAPPVPALQPLMGYFG